MSSSSNDLLADRRVAWARAMAREGDHAAAADLLEQVVERVPGWAPGWAALAEARERAGAPEAARAAWLRVAALDGAGTLGAEPHLARLEGRAVALPAPYLRALFDDYAPRFDRHLVEALGYDGPAVLLEGLARAAPGRRFAHALDLGCGTGLMGRALAGRAERIDGVDLSPAMVERARETGAYDGLAACSLEEALAGAGPGHYDLVTAADVFVYLGDLGPVAAGIAAALAPGGLLAFTVQLRDTGFALGPDMRFSHGEDHVAVALAAAGLRLALIEPASTRREAGRAVPGLVAVAAR